MSGRQELLRAGWRSAWADEAPRQAAQCRGVGKLTRVAGWSRAVRVGIAGGVLKTSRDTFGFGAVQCCAVTSLQCDM